jgi:hypothetical protein
MVKYGIGIVALIAATSVNAMDDARKTECGVNYLTLALVTSALGGKEASGTDAEKTTYNDAALKFAGRAMTIFGVSTVDTLPPAVMPAVKAKVSTISENVGPELEKSLALVKACDAEQGL